MASVTPALGAGRNPFAERSDISADGRYVIFVSDATNLVGRRRRTPRATCSAATSLTGTTIAVTVDERAPIAADSPADQRRRLEGRVRELRAARSRRRRTRPTATSSCATSSPARRGWPRSAAASSTTPTSRAAATSSADGTRVPFDNAGVYVRDLVANAPLTGLGRSDGDVQLHQRRAARSPGFLLGACRPRPIGQLAAGNDVAAPALTFANGRVTVAADPSGVAQVLVGGDVVRLDADASAAVAADAAVEVWDGSGNRSDRDVAGRPRRRRRLRRRRRRRGPEGDEGEAVAGARAHRQAQPDAGGGALPALDGRHGPAGGAHGGDEAAGRRRSSSSARRSRARPGQRVLTLTMRAEAGPLHGAHRADRQGRGDEQGQRRLPHQLTVARRPSSGTRGRGAAAVRCARGRPARARLPGPVLMGVVNVTPDSFSDGGRFLDPDARDRGGAAPRRRTGAAIVDIGGESTRPGSDGVPLARRARARAAGGRGACGRSSDVRDLDRHQQGRGRAPRR